MNAEKTVREFCDAVRHAKSAELATFFTEDAVYHNIPVEPVNGREMIQATLAQFIDISNGAEFEILALAVSGNCVLTERIDRFTINGKRIELPVMGAFEVNADDKISAWRDYFDMQQFMKQMA
jgi:limonene-1,2-epoxide hydrolase